MRHLVLGGSSGLGKAYASFYARRGHVLTVVARDASGLKDVRADLLELGAASVAIEAGDLLDRAFRARLFGLEMMFDTILVGGPSPPAGNLSAVSAESLQVATEALIMYPFEAARWALSTSLVEKGRLIVLSSSSVNESLCDHPFFLSALLRRTLDQLVGCMADSAKGKSVTIWKPRVVATRLAVAYASAQVGSKDLPAITRYLQEAFDVEFIPTPEEWVSLQLAGE